MICNTCGENIYPGQSHSCEGGIVNNLQTKDNIMGSKSYQLNTQDGQKILKVFGWLMASTVVAFLINLLPQVDFGAYVWVVPFINLVLVAVKKFIQDNS